MSDYAECPECGSNKFMLEWGRIECENGHGLEGGWPSASMIDTQHLLALKDDAILTAINDEDWALSVNCLEAALKVSLGFDK